MTSRSGLVDTGRMLLDEMVQEKDSYLVVSVKEGKECRLKLHSSNRLCRDFACENCNWTSDGILPSPNMPDGGIRALKPLNC